MALTCRKPSPSTPRSPLGCIPEEGASCSPAPNRAADHPQSWFSGSGVFQPLHCGQTVLLVILSGVRDSGYSFTFCMSNERSESKTGLLYRYWLNQFAFLAAGAPAPSSVVSFAVFPPERTLKYL